MPFFPCAAYSSNASLTPLLQLFNELDSSPRSAPRYQVYRTQVRSFRPRFDVRELEDAYELTGELAGVSKNDLHIEFTDPRTLRVHGRVDRFYNSSTASRSPAEDSQADAVDGLDESNEKPVLNHRQPTVEDEDEFENIESPDSSTNQTARADDETTEKEAEHTAQVEAASAEVPEAHKPVDNARYWIKERSIGEFSRTFSFPVQLQQDDVTANLDEGILSIRIPKTPAHEGRRHIQLS